VTEDESEVREAVLRCRACAHEARVEGGIVDLMHEAPEFVVREADGLARFSAMMRSYGWDRDRVLSLPYVQDGYWYAQATAMHQTLHQNPFQPGDLVLDVGSNTCWASAMFVERNLRVVALDILTDAMQGLGTADLWMDAKNIHFERLRSVMFAPALASGAFDWVWCCEVLHHNHRENLERTLAELYRVLKPGGKLLVVNETLRSLRHPDFRPRSGAVANVEEWEGHEHSYLRRTYLRAAKRSGFEVAVKGPWYLGAFREDLLGISPRMGMMEGFHAALTHATRRHPRVRRLYLTWKSYVTGKTALFFLGTKPDSSSGQADRASGGAAGHPVEAPDLAESL
jgi:SAM-dependent methyltransferase